MMPIDNPASKPIYRLLLVEDYAPLASATEEFLSAAGLEVRIATSGAEALNAAPTFQPEIVLCDLSLPDMSGLDVARALRENPLTKDVLFALHTAVDEVEVRELQRTLTPRVDLVLPKPITMEKVKNLVDKLGIPPGIARSD